MPDVLRNNPFEGVPVRRATGDTAREKDSGLSSVLDASPGKFMAGDLGDRKNEEQSVSEGCGENSVGRSLWFSICRDPGTLRRLSWRKLKTGALSPALDPADRDTQRCVKRKRCQIAGNKNKTMKPEPPRNSETYADTVLSPVSLEGGKAKGMKQTSKANLSADEANPADSIG